MLYVGILAKFHPNRLSGLGVKDRRIVISIKKSYKSSWVEFYKRITDFFWNYLFIFMFEIVVNGFFETKLN